MTTPTSEQIRLAAWQEWNRWRHDEDVAAPYQGRLADLVGFHFACSAFGALWVPASEDDDGSVTAILQEIVDPAIAAAEANVLEAVVAALERFASEFPDAPRAVVKPADKPQLIDPS